MSFRLPALTWLRHYDKGWLRSDVVAGITLAAYLLPAGLGDASLANLPPQAGLYACLFGGMVFWLFCSSRHFQDVRLVSLASWRGANEINPRDRGRPYMGTQEGYDPKYTKVRVDEFVFRQFGKWLSLNHFFCKVLESNVRRRQQQTPQDPG